MCSLNKAYTIACIVYGPRILHITHKLDATTMSLETCDREAVAISYTGLVSRSCRNRFEANIYIYREGSKQQYKKEKD